VGIDIFNKMGKPNDEQEGSIKLNQTPQMVTQSAQSSSGVKFQYTVNTTTTPSLYQGFSGIYTVPYNFDYYAKEREIHGDEVVNKYLSMRNMTIEEFIKTEFYKDVLKNGD
jgi:hypothetical protein